MILSFDTSAAHCAAALVSEDRVVALRHEEMARGQAERLFPLLGEMMAEASIGWPDLAALAVGTGPGNFTGIRVAVAAARGLSLATGLPAYGVDGFDARAEGMPTTALVCIAAPRGLVHARDMINGNTETITPEDAAALATARGLALVGEAVGAPGNTPLTVAIAHIAGRRLAASEAPQRPVPCYVRPPDAARARHAAPKLIS